MKTYSRRAISRAPSNGEPPAKRRRVSNDEDGDHNTMTTSLSSDSATDDKHQTYRASSILSSTAPSNESSTSSNSPAPQCTPPSSPPIARPLDESQCSPPPDAQLATRRTLVDITSNVQRPSKPKRRPKQRYTQLQIDLGQSMTKHCKICGMNYVSSNAEDSALHQKFHALSVGGVDLGRSFVDSDALRGSRVWSGEGRSFVVECNRMSGGALLNKARKVLDVASKELGAVEITDEQLWGSLKLPASSKQVRQDSISRYKAYLYLRGSKCIGLCLAERISKAHKVLAPKPRRTSPQRSPITVADDVDDVLLGISRIWTSSSHRKEGIATRLLQCARMSFAYGVEISKEQMAFSQPTDSGGGLARTWFGAEAGWHVYVET